jgi:hypothetical protein
MSKRNGQTTKYCLECREKDTAIRKKPEIAERRKQAHKEKKYYQTYRNKKREENEEEFKKHNAETMKNWRNNNSEHVTEWRRTNVNYKLRGLKSQAKDKGYIWSDEMTDEVAKNLMTNKCYYCDFLDDKYSNGIDRMDSKVGYILTNCVSCCKTCNFIKKSLDARTFVERCIHIASCHGNGDTMFESAWPQSSRATYSDYKERAQNKELAFEITKEQFKDITTSPCHYCHRENNKKNGIDRKNNDIGYISDNIVPCCAECNCMKTSLNTDVFIDGCKRVANHANLSQIPDMPRCYTVICRRSNS